MTKDSQNVAFAAESVESLATWTRKIKKKWHKVHTVLKADGTFLAFDGGPSYPVGLALVT